LSWYEAFLFCIWDGGRLPTDAEGNYAAAGGDQQRAFPWSTPADALMIVPTDAVFDRGTGRLNLANAGSISGRDARWGHRDLAGNNWEWVFDACQDCQGPTFETPELSTYDSTCKDCVSLLGNKRFFRGGSWKYPSYSVRTAFRAGTSPEVRYDDLGVRCARNPLIQ
jgi:formylglycine-generating enzyme required for sulfatase activity